MYCIYSRSHVLMHIRTIIDEPATWTEETLDQGVGAPVHGIATVLDSGGVNIDFLLDCRLVWIDAIQWYVC